MDLTPRDFCDAVHAFLLTLADDPNQLNERLSAALRPVQVEREKDPDYIPPPSWWRGNDNASFMSMKMLGELEANKTGRPQ